MNQWAFVIAAYALVAAAVVSLIAWSLAGMRRAERALNAVKRRP